MTISAESWVKYINALSKVNEAATNELAKFIDAGFSYSNPDDMRRLIAYAYGVSTKYGEAAAELACQMYDAVGLASGMLLEPAAPAEVATYGDVAKTIYGTAKQSQNTDELLGAMVRLVKRAGQDTTIKNALRDGAQFAWIPHGDTCAFCLALASRGWQDASKDAVKNGHAEHIHANCDCAYAVRFTPSTQVRGYDPDRYLKMYYDAPLLEGQKDNAKNRINAMRRQAYARNKDEINAQKRAAYEKRQELNSSEAEEIDVN